MKSKFLLLIVIFLSCKNYSQSKENDLSKIKFCEFKITNFKDIKQVKVVELDDCKDGVSGLRIPGYERNTGYVSSKFNGVIFQNHIVDSTVSNLILTKKFKGFLPDGTYIDLINLKGKDILNKYSKIYWTSSFCTDYVQIVYQNIHFYIKKDKSIKPYYGINQKLYSEKNIESITIRKTCSNRKILGNK